jgi:hypothetical protein
MIRTSTMGDYYGRLENPQAAEAGRNAASTTSREIAAGVSSLHD